MANTSHYRPGSGRLLKHPRTRIKTPKKRLKTRIQPSSSRLGRGSRVVVVREVWCSRTGPQREPALQVMDLGGATVLDPRPTAQASIRRQSEKMVEPAEQEQLQHELGGPLTPSPANSPLKKSYQQTPSSSQGGLEGPSAIRTSEISAATGTPLHLQAFGSEPPKYPWADIDSLYRSRYVDHPLDRTITGSSLEPEAYSDEDAISHSPKLSRPKPFLQRSRTSSPNGYSLTASSDSSDSSDNFPLMMRKLKPSQKSLALKPY